MSYPTDVKTIRKGSLSGELNKEIQYGASEYIEHEFAVYNKLADILFSYLHKVGKKISPVQYQIYRDNHFFRTLGVLPALARALEVAAWRGDHQTVSDLGKTIFEECGETKMPHLYLLEEAFNLHGKTIFGLAPIKMQDAEFSPYLLDEAKRFRQVQKDIFAHGGYPELLAATCVRERAAQTMLTNFYEALFLPYGEQYRQIRVDFGPIRQFFTSHIEGVEDEHALHAMRDALSACRDKNDLQLFKDGVKKLLSAQADLWQALYQRMREESL
jgi:hypothetical protein